LIFNNNILLNDKFLQNKIVLIKIILF
jgi:hypothetical protein